MSTPRYIQRKRTKGFKLPENTICVNRGTKYGNPFKVGEMATIVRLNEVSLVNVPTPQSAVDLFASYMESAPERIESARKELKGKNIACFCSEDEDVPCHGKWLLEVVNSE